MRHLEEPTLGIVIPVHNEEPVLPYLLRVLRSLDFGVPTRVLFVDDGSKDKSLEVLLEACQQNEHYACLSLSRNFGHQVAVTAGLRHCRGDIVVVLDADLQDPPKLIVEFIQKWREGYDIVYGIRTDRKESRVLKIAYWAFYRLLSSIANVSIPRDAGMFALMDRRVVNVINTMPEHRRWLPGLRSWAGFEQFGIEYPRPARQAGRTNYNTRRLMAVAFDAFFSFSSLPLKVASWAGVTAALLGFGYMLFALYAKVTGQALEGWTSIIIVILLLGGLQLIVLGIIGEYMSRISDDVKRRPVFVARGMYGWLKKLDN